MAVEQSFTIAIAQVRVAQFDVAARDAHVGKRQPVEQPAERGPDAHLRAVRQLRHDAHHSEDQPGRPITRGEQARPQRWHQRAIDGWSNLE